MRQFRTHRAGACAFRKPACLALHAPLHPLRTLRTVDAQTEAGLVRALRVHAAHQHDVPVATYWAVKTRALVAQELVRAALVTGTRLYYPKRRGQRTG